LALVEAHRRCGEIATGLLYHDTQGQDMHSRMNTVNTPLNALRYETLCPGAETLAAINAGLR
jgi:2-oxoglutarate ferredoxin oxidoreductase subunit beta